MTAERNRWSPSLRLVAVAVGFIAAALAFCTTSVDDSFITMRYAHNLVHGLGPVFNPGERVEGFTSPLHLVVAVAVELMPGASVLLKLKLLSMIPAIGAVALSTRLIERTVTSRWLQFVAAVLIGASFPVAAASTNGLETGLILLLTTLLCSLAADGSARQKPVQFGLVAGLMVLARPEAALIAAVVISIALLGPRLRPSAEWLRATVAGSTLVVTTELARLAYYRSLVPNTFYAKNGPLRRSLEAGVTYNIRSFVLDVPTHVSSLRSDPVVGSFQIALMGILLALLVLGFVRLWRGGHGVIVGAIAAQMAAVTWVGGDWMPSRFVSPVWPLVVISLVVGVEVLSDVRVNERIPRLAIAIAAVAFVATGSATQWTDGRVKPVWTADSFGDAALLRAAQSNLGEVWSRGNELLACARPGDLVAHTEVGYAGYTNLKLRFFDPRGLVNKRLARESPSSERQRSGVVDLAWRSPASFMGHELMQAQPVLIVSFDGPPTDTALDGRYVLVSVQQFHRRGESQTLRLGVYRRADFACP